MIALMADPALMPLTNALVDDPDHRLWLLTYSADRFGPDDSLPPDGIGVTSVIPQFLGDTASTSGTRGCTPARHRRPRRCPPGFHCGATALAAGAG
jgi:hypothetical protein